MHRARYTVVALSLAACTSDGGPRKGWDPPDIPRREDGGSDGGSATPDASTDIDADLRADADASEAADGSSTQTDSGAGPSCGAVSCVHGTCSGTTCTCEPGFRGADCAEDIDECRGSDHGCSAVFPCQNTPGGYTCRGQMIDAPIRNRVLGVGTPAEQGWSVDLTAGVVHDQTTGLAWERRPPMVRDTTDYAVAEARCSDLTLGDQDDWRIPTFHEVMTLLSYANQPAQDVNIFPEVFYSAWTVNGTATLKTLVAHGTPWVYGLPIDNPNTWHNTPCVSTDAVLATGTPATRYISDASANTVRDIRTALTWELAATPLSVTYAEAVAHCASLPGYRLPAFLEALSTLDGARSPQVRSAVFTGPDGFYWTSSLQTTVTAAPAHLMVESLATRWDHGKQGDGTETVWLTTSTYVRCVKPD